MAEINYGTKRANFMSTFKHDPMMSVQIPDIAAKLFARQFGVNIMDNSYIPIIFTTGWKVILQKLGSSQFEDCGMDVCGIRVEYKTLLSESDKSTNIVPQMFNIRIPLFTEAENQEVLGSDYTNVLLSKYTAWRSVYKVETTTDVENTIFSEVLTNYGINLVHAAAIYPLLGAIYAAGVQLSRENKIKVNMYNIFEIVVTEDDQVIINPLAFVKQWLKDDSKK